MNDYTVILNLLILLANVCLLAIMVKLYTEYFKDRSARKRERSK